MRKTALGLAAMTALATTLTACGGSGGGASSDTITVSMWAGGEEDTKWLKSQIAIAEKANPDLTIKLRTSPWDAYFTKLTTELASGEAACVVGMNSSMLGGYTKGLVKLEDADLEAAGIDWADYNTGSDEILAYQGDTYGAPFDVAAMLVYTNQDMLKEAGAEDGPKPGWTWDDFVATAKKATTKEHKGTVVDLTGYQETSLPISVSGVQPVKEDGSLDLTNPAYLEAQEEYVKLVTEHKVAAPVPSAAEVGWSSNEYSAGNVAMAVDGTWNAVGYLENEAGFTAGMAPLPAGESGKPLSLLLGSGYSISESCENKEGALKVMSALLGKEAQDDVASSGRSYPARTESQPLYFESMTPEQAAVVKPVFEDAFANVQGEHHSEAYGKVSEMTGPEMVNVFNGKGTVTELLEQAQAQFGG